MPETNTYPDGRRPPSRVPKAERILNLISALLHADQPIPVAEILGKVTGYDDAATRDSLMRRFERDKKVLRDIGIPIEHATAGTFGQEGYSIPRNAYFLDELVLPPESSQLLRTLFAWAHAEGGELSADLRSALIKLGFLVTTAPDDFGPAANPEPLDPAPKGQGSAAGVNLKRLSEAVLFRKQVSFRYHSLGRDDEYAVTVSPYGLGFDGQAWGLGAWYLIGRSHRADDLRVFKVRRIRGTVELVGKAEAFERPEGFRTREHLGKSRWEFKDLDPALAGDSSPPPYQAVVGFEDAVVSEVRVKAPGAKPTERPATGRAGFTYLAFDVQQERPLLRFLLRFVPRLHVQEPAALDDALRTMAREVLERYVEEGVV
ncbi:MAG: WYL domain-containing protein [Planctomycetes bacterium]|nr:WYL domain-containing protein [Planctomycetota bacterium]